MNKLSKREKNIIAFCTVLGLLVAYSGVKRLIDKDMEKLNDDLVATQQQLDAVKASLATAISASNLAKPKTEKKEDKPVGQLDKKHSLYLLRDITLPELNERVRIVSAEKKGEGGYSVTLEGEFSETMRFISYIERRDGKFSVNSVSFLKAPANEKDKQPSRLIQTTLSLAMKG